MSHNSSGKAHRNMNGSPHDKTIRAGAFGLVALMAGWCVLPGLHRLTHEEHDLAIWSGSCATDCNHRDMPTGEPDEHAPEGDHHSATCQICKVSALAAHVVLPLRAPVATDRLTERQPCMGSPVAVMHRLAPTSRGPPAYLIPLA